MKKQVSVVLAAAIAGGLLAGCGSTKPAETTAAAGTNGAGETQAEAAAGDVTIDVWHSMEGSNGEAFEAMVKNFNETTGKELGITANSVFQGSDTAGKLKTLIQTDDVANMPDVCLL